MSVNAVVKMKSEEVKARRSARHEQRRAENALRAESPSRLVAELKRWTLYVFIE